MPNPPRRPTFIIGGAPRSGTTLLCHALERHPDVYIAKPYLPEPKVFLGPEQGQTQYQARYAELFADAGDRRALGEKTSRYFESAAACQRIRTHLPEVRMLFILREPVARAYSNYLWSAKNGLETLPFEDAVDLEGRRDAPAAAAHARPFDYLARGDYDVFARWYYDAFGRDAVRFCLYEELIAEAEPVLHDLQRFVGVEPIRLGVADLGVINSAREVGPAIRLETEARLRRRMAPIVQRFRALTGLDLGAWGYDGAS
jgi:Sulfotransferase family